MKNNKILFKEDESSIEPFKDDDIIIIDENRVFPDNSYYNSLIENITNDDILNIHFCEGGKNKFLIFPKYITVEQMLKAFYFKYGYKKNDIIFSESIQIKKKLWEINPLIHYSKTGDVMGYFLYIFGKKIKAIVLF